MAKITMARHIHMGTRGIVYSALITFFLATLCAAAATRTNALPGADIFDGPTIVRINISIPEAGIRALRGYHFNGNLNQDRPEARATVVDGSRTYKDVAIHLKGAAGSFQPVDGRPSMTLNFDKFVKGQTFHGLEKISLNNSVQDPTYINEKISRELMAKAGVPVPRSDYAVVTLNGRNLGFYVLVEGYNKQLLKRYFKNVSGNLYDGGFCQEVADPGQIDAIDVNSGDKPQDRSDLAQLARATAQTREQNRPAELSKVLDVDRFLTMMAMEVLLCHWDGYAMNRNNYRVFSDKESGKLIFMPHGMDQVFGIGGMGSPQTSIFPQMKGMVARALVGTTDGRSRYRMRLAELRTNIFNAEAVSNRVREIERRIQPVLAETRASAGTRHQSMVNILCRNIGIRAQNLDAQLGEQPEELKFGKNGIASLEGWRPRNTTSAAHFDTVVGPEGKSLLFVRGDPSRPSAVSWRTRAMLPRGMYRFQGRVRTKGPAAAAALRISGARNVNLVQGEADWGHCVYEFAIEEAVADVELVCELRGGNGSAWFDVDSLQLVRLQ